MKKTKADKRADTTPVIGDQVQPIHDEIFLGLDLHSEHIRVVRQMDRSNPQPAQRLSWEQIVEFCGKQLGWAKKVYAVSEAGAFGYGLCRELRALGIEAYVMKPCKLDPQNKRVQTDQSDAREMAQMLERYVRGNPRAMSVVQVPTPEQEAQRIESRHRVYLKKELLSLAAHGRGLLLSQGWGQVGKWWQDPTWEVLRAKVSDPLRESLADGRKLIQEYEKLLQPVEKKLTASAPKSLPHGMGALTFVLLLREIFHWQRFKNRRQVGRFMGLCGGVSSSGPQHFDLSITKTGNRHLRTWLIELAWRFVRYQPDYKPLKNKWGAILKDRQSHRRHRQRAIVALARQLAVDLWKWQTGRVTARELGWIMNSAA